MMQRSLLLVSSLCVGGGRGRGVVKRGEIKWQLGTAFENLYSGWLWQAHLSVCQRSVYYGVGRIGAVHLLSRPWWRN